MRFDQGAGEGRGYGREGRSEVEQPSKRVVRAGKRSWCWKEQGDLDCGIFFIENVQIAQVRNAMQHKTVALFCIHSDLVVTECSPHWDSGGNVKRRTVGREEIRWAAL